MKQLSKADIQRYHDKMERLTALYDTAVNESERRGYYRNVIELSFEIANSILDCTKEKSLATV